MIIDFEGREWTLDLRRIKLKQGVAIHYAYGLNVNEMLAGLPALDSRAYHAAYWLMRQQAGEKISLDDADGDLIDFIDAFNNSKMSEREQREADEAQAKEDAAAVPTSPPSDEVPSPGPAIPTATTPQPLDLQPDLTGS